MELSELWDVHWLLTSPSKTVKAFSAHSLNQANDGSLLCTSTHTVPCTHLVKNLRHDCWPPTPGSLRQGPQLCVFAYLCVWVYLRWFLFYPHTLMQY